MKSKVTFVVGAGILLSLTYVVSRIQLPSVMVAVFLFVMCIVVMFGMGWISKRNSNAESQQQHQQ
jgi:type III secretory pathway component EscS